MEARAWRAWRVVSCRFLLALVGVVSATRVRGEVALAPHTPMWGDGVQLMTYSSAHSVGISGDGLGGAYVAATGLGTAHTGLPGEVRLMRLGADGQRHPAWPSDGLVLLRDSTVPAFARLRVIRDALGGIVVVGEAPDDEFNGMELEARVVQDPSPRVERVRYSVRFGRDWRYRHDEPSPLGVLWTLGFERDSLRLRCRWGLDAPASGWPQEGLLLDQNVGPSGGGRLIGHWQQPRSLVDGRLGIVYSSIDLLSPTHSGRIELLRVDAVSLGVERASIPIFGSWRQGLWNWTLDDSQRPVVVVGDTRLREVIALDWDGHERWRETLFPDSSWNSENEVEVAPDGRGGVYIGFPDHALRGHRTPFRILHRQDDMTAAQPIYGLAPRWYDSDMRRSPFRFWPGRDGGLVACLQCMGGMSFFGTSDHASVLSIDSAGDLAGQDSMGTRIFGSGSVWPTFTERDATGDIFAAMLVSDGPGQPFRVIAQRMHADQPVATLASRVTANWESGELVLHWRVSGEVGSELRVERSLGSDAFEQFAFATPDGSDRIEVRDATVPAGARVRYRLHSADAVLDTWEIVAPGAAELALALHGSPGAPTLARVSLVGSGDAQLDVFDVAGRRLATYDLSRHTSGEHDVALEAADAPGLLLVRLREGGRQRLARHVRLR